MTQNTTTPDLIKRMERIVRSEYAHHNHMILDCDLGQITFGDVRDLCDAVTAERDALKAEVERKDAEIARLREALTGLECACEQLAATRTHEVYLAMIDSGQGDALISLDARRQSARAALRAEQKGDA